MDKQRGGYSIAVVAALALVALNVGCATKKYVRNTVEPFETRLGKVEEQGNENSRRITEVDQNAQQGIGEAKTQAKSASQEAASAGNRAQSAEALAQKGLSEADQVREELRNADNFQVVKTATVHFGFDKDELSEEATKSIDELASVAQSSKKYVIEVEGFTDRVGPEKYNLDLSRRRADTVVRYLTMTHKIPLARVFEIGYGKEQPAAPNESREGRELNRRVEVRILAVQEAAEQGTQAQATKPGGQE